MGISLVAYLIFNPYSYLGKNFNDNFMLKINTNKNGFLVRGFLVLVLLFYSGLVAMANNPVDPADQKYEGRKGTRLYVSKMGNNSDGTSWEHAFHSIQAALLAVPDDKGGHLILIRPDTYVEANLFPAFKGAAGSYNLLVGDTDGQLGSGATGRIIIDASDPERGFKSYDWWGTIRSTTKAWRSEFKEQTFSGIGWDRWILRNLYTSGGDAGFFWDLTNKSGEGFTVLLEDCVGIGRAFGGGICYPVVRPNEPSIFRRCYFLSLDWLGDAAAVLVGGWETTMPASPHLILEDCTLVHPDNALAMSYASKCVRVRAIGCRMVVLNFTQTEMGGKSTGIICSQGHHPAGRLHVDLEDCFLAGYSLFTNGKDGEATSYTVKGKVQAYVQFRQSLPAGFERINLWPAELFDRIAIPKPGQVSGQHPSPSGNPYGLKIVDNMTVYKKSIIDNPSNKLVDLEKAINKVVLDIRYATTNNFTHQRLYSAPKALVRQPVADALQKIQMELKVKGIGLKIFDAYRPYAITLQFYKVYPDTTFVASPRTGSRHNRGCAVDLTLVDLKSGKELEMPTPFDDFTAKAAQAATNLPPKALKNRQLLREIMKKYGFSPLASEWWHYDFNGWQNYPLMDLSFEELSSN